MNCHPTFDDMPPIRLTESHFASTHDNHVWPMDVNDSGPSLHGQASLIWNQDFPFLRYDSKPTLNAHQDETPSYLNSSSRASSILSGIHDLSHPDTFHPGLLSESVAVHSQAFPPVMTHCNLDIPPNGAIGPYPSGLTEQYAWREGYSSTDPDSNGSPGPITPRIATARFYQGSCIQHGGPTGSWLMDSCCAPHEIQQVADEDNDHCARNYEEPYLALGELDIKEEQYCPGSIPTMTQGEAISFDYPPTMPAGVSKPCSSSSSDNDSDYKPQRANTRRGKKRVTSHQGKGRVKSGVTKRSSSKTSITLVGKGEQEVRGSIAQKPASQNKKSGKIKPYSCPLAPYGCHHTFPSKNEWRRHFLAIHLGLEFFRCDECLDSTSRPNEFSRKDLLAQHLRRMHHPHKHAVDNGTAFRPPSSYATLPAAVERQPDTKSSKQTKAELREAQVRDPANEAFERSIPDHIARCRVQGREAPAHCLCGFCERRFDGPTSFEDWVEHTARHMADAAKNRAGDGFDASWATSKWYNDVELREWLWRHGLLRRGPQPGTFVMTDKAVKK